MITVTFEILFSVTGDLLQYSSVILICEGLDTISNVSINGRIVGTSDNMFVRYTYDIKPYLKVITYVINTYQSPDLQCLLKFKEDLS